MYVCVCICYNKDIALEQHKTYGSATKYVCKFVWTYSAAGIFYNPEISGFKNFRIRDPDILSSADILFNTET